MFDFVCCFEKNLEVLVSFFISVIEIFVKRIYFEKEKGEYIFEWDDYIFM